jgi:hypothetical protein
MVPEVVDAMNVSLTSQQFCNKYLLTDCEGVGVGVRVGVLVGVLVGVSDTPAGVEVGVGVGGGAAQHSRQSP